MFGVFGLRVLILGCVGLYSFLFIGCLIERCFRSGDIVFRFFNWLFLLFGLFKTVFGSLSFRCCYGGGEE